jgi:hypothetical protein
VSERQGGEVEQGIALARFGPVDYAGDLVIVDEYVRDLPMRSSRECPRAARRDQQRQPDLAMATHYLRLERARLRMMRLAAEDVAVPHYLAQWEPVYPSLARQRKGEICEMHTLAILGMAILFVIVILCAVTSWIRGAFWLPRLLTLGKWPPPGAPKPFSEGER